MFANQPSGAGDVLRGVNLNIMDNDHCHRLYEKAEIPVTKKMICAGFHDGNEQACHVIFFYIFILLIYLIRVSLYQGYSGSGLICANNLSGIVSFGKECFYKETIPGVYTDVSNYSEFIDTALKLEFVKKLTKSSELRHQSNEAADLWSTPILIVVFSICNFEIHHG